MRTHRLFILPATAVLVLAVPNLIAIVLLLPQLRRP